MYKFLPRFATEERCVVKLKNGQCFLVSHRMRRAMKPKRWVTVKAKMLKFLGREYFVKVSKNWRDILDD